jgi:hypothetical protein
MSTEHQALATLVSQKVVASWVALSDRPPWDRLTTADRIDHLAPLLESLFRAVYEETDHRTYRAEMIRDAATHGEERRAQGYDEEIILEEYYLIRDLLWTELRARLAPGDAAPIIIRVDAALSLASAACLRGMHREALEAAGQWPRALDVLVERDPLTE